MAEIDPGARNFVERQRADRHGEMERLSRSLQRRKCLPQGTTQRRAFAVLMVLTSYETYRELGHTGLSDAEITRTLHESSWRCCWLIRPGPERRGRDSTLETTSAVV